MKKDLKQSKKGTQTSSQSPEGQVCQNGIEREIWAQVMEEPAHFGNVNNPRWLSHKGKWKTFR